MVDPTIQILRNPQPVANRKTCRKNRKYDSIKRTRVLLNLALNHFKQSQQFEVSGDLEDARYELATAEEYRDIYWHRVEAEERSASEC